MVSLTRKSPPRAGRPSREQARLLGDRILDIATGLFLEIGYGDTTIELVAEKAQISKRTLYHRYPDKAALFGTVVRRIVGRLRPPDVAGLFTGGSLEEILVRLAGIILRAALNPQALALHRIIMAEATRFPELAAAVADRSASQEAIERIAALLQREVTAARLPATAAQFAAVQFLQMVIASPQRRALGRGLAMGEPEMDRWAKETVSLFLNGYRGWAVPLKRFGPSKRAGKKR
jgi:TetR/AcrR family transcriptional regulator, mexJK operon transcriptional repressor